MHRVEHDLAVVAAHLQQEIAAADPCIEVLVARESATGQAERLAIA
jgi:hypothetical protein